MGVRLIAGRAGSGKTWRCQNEIRRALDARLVEGPRLIMLVPEQAALQMERGLLSEASAQALGRCEVLSFRRLAGRILAESIGPSPAPLTPTGRQMALRLLLSRLQRSLREFGRVSERPGFITELSRGVAELLQEAVSVDRLDASVQDAEEAGDPAASRLHDLSLIYRAYLEYLGDKRVDPEGVLDLARARLTSADWLRDAHIWIDGFAGFTQQQMRMIAALGNIASHVDIALLLDPNREQQGDDALAPGEASLFARTEQTWATLRRVLQEAGQPVEPMVSLVAGDHGRFERSKLLASLERRFFSAPPLSDSAAAELDAKQDDEGENGSTSSPEIRLVEARDRRAEVDAAVRTVVDLVQREEDPLRYRDVAIIVRELEPYHDLISAALRRHGIPFFIDRRRPTHHHPLIQAIRALLALLGGGRFDESIVRLIKSGLSGLSDVEADALENHCLALGLTSPDMWESSWTAQGDSFEPVQALTAPPEAEAARAALCERLGDWWPSSRNRSGHPKARTWVERLYAVIERFKVADRLAGWCEQAEAAGHVDEATEHEQVWSDLIALLDELAAALGDEVMTARRFREVLESGLSEFTLGLTPPTIDQLLVGSIERSRHPPVRATLILGFCDGAFPARFSDDAILGDRELAFLEKNGAAVARTRRQRILDERLLAYVAVTRPSEYLWVGYPQADEAGRPISPSPYWASLRSAVPEARVETVEADAPSSVGTASDLAGGLASAIRVWSRERIEAEAVGPWLALYEWARRSAPEDVRATTAETLRSLSPVPQATLPEEIAARLWPKPHRTNVTKLEAFARCPYRHFAAYGLRLMERPRHEVAVAHYGQLYHTILEQFVNEMIESGVGLHELSSADIAERLDQLCDRFVPEYAASLNLDRSERRAVSWRSKRELPDSVEGHRRTVGKTHLAPWMAEREFGSRAAGALPALELPIDDRNSVLVTGKIDRVDFVQAGDDMLAVVFDYKRSLNKRLRLEEVFHGLTLQLLAYLLVIRDCDGSSEGGGAKVIPGGAFYLPLLGSMQRVAHPDEADEEGFEPYKGFRPRGVVDFDWIDSLETTPPGAASSAFQFKRKKDGDISNMNYSDAVPSGGMTLLLEHVRTKLIELARSWLGGEIAVCPARLGKSLSCVYCPYISVCRFEHATHAVRAFPAMSRDSVIDVLKGQSEDADA